VRIDTPTHEMRIGAVHRGAGPRDLKAVKWQSFDGYLQGLALSRGARHLPERVDGVAWEDGRPRLATRAGSTEPYDLVAVATGVNSTLAKLFENTPLPYRPPETSKTFIREYFLGEETVERILGSSMHVFLLDIPRLEFAAIIPKGDYITVCLLGDEIDNELVDRFMQSPEVRATLPADLPGGPRSCQCSPRISVRGAIRPFADRMVFVGDCGVTRLYKDGIGAAYRTAKAAATTAVLQGVSEGAFRRHFWPMLETINRDNMLGRVTFAVTGELKKRRFTRLAIFRMVAGEQRHAGPMRRMSRVLWDVFTGSAPYRVIFLRTLHPAFVGRFLWHTARAALAAGRRAREEVAA
jgi:flavin-dependent dehydrogenase